MTRFTRIALAASAALTLATAGCDAPTPGGPGGPGATGPGATGPSGVGASARPTSPQRAQRPIGKNEQDLPAGTGAVVKNLAAATKTGQAGKLLLAIYLIGSDLEDGLQDGQAPTSGPNAGAGSADLSEIRDAYLKLTPAQQANLDVFVVFGGARQDHWVGTKAIDMAGIVKDGADGFYGNDTADTYLEDVPGADMGDPATFEAFVRQVQARQGTAAKTFLDIWDHGGSFAGMGPDQNTKGILGNDETKSVLDKLGFRADIIGFDACLMASVEVVAAVVGHADYLIASEETEPGHGWDYETWLLAAAARPEITTGEIGAALVDTFLDSEKHAVTNGRTLSMINLDAAPALLAATDALGEALAARTGGGLDPIVDAHRDAQKYGSHGGNDDEFARDLSVFAARLAKQDPGLASVAQAVKDAVTACVAYAREDGTKPGSKGLTIYSFSNAGWFEGGYYSAATASGPGYLKFVQAVNARAAGDTTAPTITEVAHGGEVASVDESEGGAAKEELGYHLAQTADDGFADGDDGEAGEGGDVDDGNDGGFDLDVTDDVVVEDVRVVHVVQPDANVGVFHVVSSESAEEYEEDGYRVPAWDGEALHLTGADGTKTQVPVEVEEEEGTYDIWAAEATWNGEDATFRMIVDQNGEVLNTWITPYDTDAKGNVTPAREQYELADGDKLAFYREVVDIDKDEERVEAGQAVTWGATADWSWEKVAGSGFYFAIAEDLKGNSQNSEVHAVK